MKATPFANDPDLAQHRVAFPVLTTHQVWALNELLNDEPPSRKVEIHQVKASRWTHTYVQVGRRQFIISQSGKTTELNVTIEKEG